MTIIYVLSTILLIILFLLIKKTNKKQNILLWIIVSVSLLVCFNTFIVYMLSFLNIKSSFLMLSFVNVIFSLIIYLFCIRNKKIQIYELNKIDLVFIGIIIIIISSLCIIRFRNGIVYDTTDSAIHYSAAISFSKHQEILTDYKSEYIMKFNSMQPMGYVNNGIMINILSFMKPYYAYLISESLTLLLFALLMYTTVRFITYKDKYSYLFAIIICFLYTLGYPLNNNIFGFSYLGYGVFSVNILCLLIYLKEFIKNNKILYYFLIFLSNFALFFSYYLFVPVVYFSLGLYYIYELVKKKYKFKEFLFIFLITLIIPFILGMIYFIIIPSLSDNIINYEAGITSEGHIYRNLFGNFIILIPLVIYSFIKEIKTKKISFELIILTITLLFTIAFLIYGLNGNASSYYYYKMYYLLWLLVWIFISKIGSYENIEYTMIGSTIMVLVLMIAISGLQIEKRIESKNSLYNSDRVAKTTVDIYNWNGAKLLSDAVVFSKDELLLIENFSNYKEQCLYNNEVLITGSYMERFWFYAITKVSPVMYFDELGDLYTYQFNYNVWLNDRNHKCLIYFKKNKNIEELEIKRLNILYENNSGYILSK